MGYARATSKENMCFNVRQFGSKILLMCHCIYCYLVSLPGQQKIMAHFKQEMCNRGKVWNSMLMPCTKIAQWYIIQKVLAPKFKLGVSALSSTSFLNIDYFWANFEQKVKSAILKIAQWMLNCIFSINWWLQTVKYYLEHTLMWSLPLLAHHEQDLCNRGNVLISML